jgi:MFS transporter, FHS family, L-fucose permease
MIYGYFLPQLITKNKRMKHQYKPLILLCLVFLTVGAMFCMNDILLPSLVKYFSLNYTQATMIQVSFYVTYIIFPLPIAWMIHRYGYRVSLLVALLTCSMGCALFFPAKIFDSYLFVLLAIFTLSTGITVLNVAANPFITLLGTPEGAHIRMNFVQVFSRIGYAATPLVATALIYESSGEIRFSFPYILLAAIILILAVFIYFSRMPTFKAEKEDKFSVTELFRESFRYKHLFYGVIAMFFYVGAEACTAGFFIPYLKEVVGLSEAEAAKYLTLYYIFAAVMGLTAVFILRFVKAYKLVGIFGLLMIFCYVIVIFIKTGYNEYILASLGLFLSIMFPTIFSLAIEDIGAFAGKGSALLNFAIVGGAVFPPLQGMVADNFSVNISYLVPMLCFVVITIYAFFFTKTTLMRREKPFNSTLTGYDRTRFFSFFTLALNPQCSYPSIIALKIIRKKLKLAEF